MILILFELIFVICCHMSAVLKHDEINMALKEMQIKSI